MVGTFRKLDYRLRPAKHAERTMLMELFRRFRFHPLQDYQYVGFGSIAFIDFRMAHKALGITDLTSIEDVEDEKDKLRFSFNRPYNFIKLEFGNSKTVLPRLSFDKPSLVWLDYDDLPNGGMLTDLSSIAAKVPSGSFIALTFTNDFPREREAREIALQRLKDSFPNYVADDASWRDFFGAKFSEFVRSTFTSAIASAIRREDQVLAKISARRLQQVCFFRYRDGAPMATIGWLILDVAIEDGLGGLDSRDLNFIRTGADAFDIKTPVLTTREIRAIERNLPGLDLAGSEIEWLPENLVEAFEQSYRFLPAFAPVETV